MSRSACGWAFRADHAIAVGRVLLAAVALADIVLDATPLAEQKLAAAILGGYTLYALAVHAIVWRRELPGGRFGLAAHVIDLVTFTVLMSLTEGPTSLLYVLLTFALLSAKLRWQWRGVLWTSAACLAILAGLQAQAVLLSTGAGAQLGVLATRLAFLAVATLMLFSLGAQQARVRAELWRLAARPIDPQAEAGWPIRAALEYAAGVFGLPASCWCGTRTRSRGSPDPPRGRHAPPGEGAARQVRVLGGRAARGGHLPEHGRRRGGRRDSPRVGPVRALARRRHPPGLVGEVRGSGPRSPCWCRTNACTPASSCSTAPA